MTPCPPVHVLLVNYNGWQDTVECLESVFRLDYPDFRVIVCDNGSPNGSLERLKAWADGRLVPEPAESETLRHLSSPPGRKPVPYREYDRADAERGGSVLPEHARLLFVQTGENLGFAGGNNVGLRYLLACGATGFVWLLNNDTVVAPDALRRLVEVAESDEMIAVVGARLLHYSRPDAVWAAGGGMITRWNGMTRLVTEDISASGSFAHASDLYYVAGTSMLMPVSVLTSVGLLDERYFMYSEETDWCMRARAAGFRLAYAATADIWHKEAKSIRRGSAAQDYFVVRNTFLFMRKFFAPFLPLAMLYAVYRCLLPKLIRGEWDRLAAVVRAYRDFVRQGRSGHAGSATTAERTVASPGWTREGRRDGAAA
jgi:GT2 family glycosyltransferase